jgi:hypothetical protein
MELSDDDQSAPDLQPPPLTFAETEAPPFLELDDPAVIDSPFQYSPGRDSIAQFRAKMLHNRLLFVHALEAQRRRDEKRRNEQALTGVIREIVLSPDFAKWDQLLAERHNIREANAASDSVLPRPCKEQLCSCPRMPGSEYCVHHILKDASQRLFVACERCSQPYLVYSSCRHCADNR